MKIISLRPSIVALGVLAELLTAKIDTPMTPIAGYPKMTDAAIPMDVSHRFDR